jgi:hypothetical protein
MSHEVRSLPAGRQIRPGGHRRYHPRHGELIREGGLEIDWD